MYGDSLNLQYANLLYAVGAGFVFGLLYDILRFLRLAFGRKKYLLIILDILFPLFVAVTTFFIALSINYGIVRFYIVAGELLGAVVYNITVSEYLFSSFVGLYNFILSKTKRICAVVLKPIYALDALLKRKTDSAGSELKKRTGKIKFFRKIDLKHRRTMLYNKLKYNFFYRMKGDGFNEREKKP